MRILIVTGSSGGHIFPALGLIDSLKEKSGTLETLLVVPKRSLESQILAGGYNIKSISTSPVNLRPDFKNFMALLRFFQGSLESLRIFMSFKPDAVVGFGGLDSVPLVLIGWMVRVRTLIHEQNCVPGRANRLLAKFCDKIAISFAQTQEYWPASKKKIVLTGNPLRQELKRVDRNKALDFFGFQDNKFTVLVMGGSHGSRKINTCFLNAVSALTDASALQIIHCGGSRDYLSLQSGYQGLNLKVKLFDFLKEMQYAYSIADLAVCRAGAMTISELVYFKIPSIIVPYPFAYRHQFHNAEALEKNGCAFTVRDDECEAGLLRKRLEEFMKTPGMASRMRDGFKNVRECRGNDLLADLVLTLE
jgi:UDP-N-acetylglucosamine--N-acetylmuramyl-(pentapeptide) pyrophosphoryl-undecaprenol N-acetylglucosamine transferase